MKKLLPVLLMAALSTAKADTLINCDRLLDGESESMQTNKTIQVKGKRIVAIHDKSAQPEGEHRTINLVDMSCMPGLIDAHVHITSQQSPNRFTDRFKKDSADQAFAAVPYAERTLIWIY